MKVLNKDQMNSVSGAGTDADMLVGMTGYDRTFNDFSDYMRYAWKNNINPMYFEKTRKEFTEWCQGLGFDAELTAQYHGLTQDNAFVYHR